MAFRKNICALKTLSDYYILTILYWHFICADQLECLHQENGDSACIIQITSATSVASTPLKDSAETLHLPPSEPMIYILDAKLVIRQKTGLHTFVAYRAPPNFQCG